MHLYGQNIRNRFQLNPRCCFLNHGSYGTAGDKPYNQRLKMIAEMEEQPDFWFRNKTGLMWNDSLLSVAEFVQAKPENIVIVNNTTTGINCVIRSLKFGKGDGILISKWTYGAVKNIINFLKNEVCDVEIHVIDIPECIVSSQNFLNLYEEKLRKHSNIKIVIIDYISSVPPCLMPVKELISLCRKYDKMVLVDGAHAPGQVALNLEGLGCDFFAGNLHKWCYAPRGCALLWIDPKYHRQIFPTAVSVYSAENLSKLFAYQGTSDNSQFYVAKTAIEFYQDIGGYEDISGYCTSLIDQAVDLLVKMWNTEQFPFPDDMKAPFMRMVRLPNLANFPISDSQTTSFVEDMTDLMAHIWDKFGIQTLCVKVYNKGWIRLSANVYNTLDDYKKLGGTIQLLAV